MPNVPSYFPPGMWGVGDHLVIDNGGSHGIHGGRCVWGRLGKVLRATSVILTLTYINFFII